MARWLLKTEPSEYSYDRLEKDKKAVWDGVTAAPAQKNMRAAKKGDLAVIYHTGDERQAVGLAEIVSDPYPAADGGVVFDLRPRGRLKVPVTLAVLKAEPAFAASPLVKMGRLSVVPLDDRQWRALVALAKTKL